ncbi:MAG: sulfite exporter TauE/SafE family protein [Phycisphaerales bacterium]|nr:sulfite exporter TauE/SafE family protein [Phycisphaerales bacterium]
MIALIGAVFAASLLGSLHCAGMCGAFVAFAVGAPAEKRPPEWALHAAYNGGRLVTYTALGGAAGLLGGALDLAGEMVGLQRLAAALAGAMMVGFGVATLLRLRGVRVGRLRLPRAMTRALEKGHRAASSRPPVVRAALIGLLTTLLPCGWLYAFVITAAGAGDAALGALTMAVFWAGTLPALVAVGGGGERLHWVHRRQGAQCTGVAPVAGGGG